MSLCPCQSEQEFSACCEPYIKGQAWPDTAEKLMRSRYTAFSLSEVDYLKSSLAPESRKDFNAHETREWSQNAKWKGLRINSKKLGEAGDQTGEVEFTATYNYKGENLDHHETSQFLKNSEGHWMFVDGDGHTHAEGEGHHHAKPQTHIREEPKIGRNDPCTCGSGKKYKKCCG